MVYAPVSKTGGGDPVWVRVPPELQIKESMLMWCSGSTAFQNKVF